ncbi:hypothetical protein RHMOL_Rhmol02G0186500 [Rhododendron molle]|uniref:Uncharacterized protein n=1 Tax=Rhododendron molle TaxID=49168 RepID=A0ACC0PU25_RHOML|nr:hypothetical protein RHMOL_Rhmol02G0186500 [Rhododendron molle]
MIGFLPMWNEGVGVAALGSPVSVLAVTNGAVERIPTVVDIMKKNVDEKPIAVKKTSYSEYETTPPRTTPRDLSSCWAGDTAADLPKQRKPKHLTAALNLNSDYN